MKNRTLQIPLHQPVPSPYTARVGHGHDVEEQLHPQHHKEPATHTGLEQKMQSVEEIAFKYETKPRPECPRCLSSERVAFIVFDGFPTPTLSEYARRPNSRVWLGGCIVSEYRFYCRACEASF